MTKETPLEYYRRKAEELGIPHSQLYPHPPIVYDADSPAGFRNSLQYVSLPNTKGIELRLRIKGQLDYQAPKTFPIIRGWSVQQTYSFALCKQTPQKYVYLEFKVDDNKINGFKKSQDSDDEIFIPKELVRDGENYLPAVDWMLKKYIQK